MPVVVYDTSGNKAVELKTLVVRVPNDLDKALRLRAASEDRNMAQVVRQALRAFLAQAD